MNDSTTPAIIKNLRHPRLRKLYCDYNERFFDNTLPTCNFCVCNEKYYLGMWIPARGDRLATICLCKRPVCVNREYWDEQMLREVLLHEMVHFYVEDVIGRRLAPFWHGYKYRKVCRMLRKKHGVRVYLSAYRYKAVPPSLRGKLRWAWGRLVDSLALLIF